MAGLLYWDLKDEGVRHRLLLPLFYASRDGDRRFFFSLPLVLGYRRPGESWTVAGPFFRARNESITRTALFPLYWQQTRTDGGRVTSLPPFLFYDYRSRDRSRVDQATLVGWRRVRPGRRSGMFLSYGWSTEPDRSFRTLFPLYWRLRAPRDRLDVWGPFYRTASITDAASDATPTTRAGLFPLAGWGTGPDRRQSHLLPLYVYSRAPDRRTFLTIPVSSWRRADGRGGHLGPYFRWRDPDLSLDGVFPLWFRRASTDGFDHRFQVLNFYRRRENDDLFHTLFPVYGSWRTPEETRFLSWGVYARTKPLPEGPSESAGWAYLYGWKNGDDGATTRVFFPLYWHFWRPPDWRLDLFFPFYARYRDGDSVLTVVPPVARFESPDRRLWSFLFFYWRNEDRERSRTSVSLFPLFHRSWSADRGLFFSPVAWSRRSPSSREGLLPPYYWYHSREKDRKILFPLWWSLHTPEAGWDVWGLYYRWRRGDDGARGLFPLWGRHRRGDRHGSYLMPFYWSSSDGRGDGDWALPALLTVGSYHQRGTPEAASQGQYLLLGNWSSGPGRREHGFFPLYQSVRREDFANFWAPRVVALAAYERRGNLRRGLVFPYFWSRRPAVDWDFLFPLVYRSRNYDVSTGTSPVRGAVSGGARMIFPLYWSGGNAFRRYRAVLPLGGYYQEGERRTTVAPLYVRHDGKAGGLFRTFFPFYWRVKSVPVDGRSKDVRVWGPWYTVQETGARGGRRTVGLAPLFARSSGGTGDHYFEILGGLFARDVQGGRRRFRFLYLFQTTPRPWGTGKNGEIR
jgi:hypothetical protein